MKRSGSILTTQEPGQGAMMIKTAFSCGQAAETHNYVPVMRQPRR